MKRYLLILSGLVSFSCISAMDVADVMDFYDTYEMKHRDLWVKLCYDGAKKSYDFTKLKIDGLKKSEEMEKFLAINAKIFLSKYLLTIEPYGQIALIEDYFKKKVIFSGRSQGLVSDFGISLSFEQDSKSSYMINYIIMSVKKNHKDTECVIHVYKHNKLIFKKKFCDEVEFYKIRKIRGFDGFDGRELIAFGFFDQVKLFDLCTGKELASIETEEQVVDCCLYHNYDYFIFSANNIVSVLDLDIIDLNVSDSVVFRANFDKNVKCGINMWKYLALAFLYKNAQKEDDTKKGTVALLDVQKKEKNLISCLGLEPKDIFGFYRGWEEFYFFMMDYERKNISIYNLYPDKFKKIFEKKFKKKIKNLSIRKGKVSYDRAIKIELENGEKRPFAVCFNDK